MIYQVNENFIVRTIGSQTMAVPVGSMTTQLHGMIALSESGALLWKAMEQGATAEQLTDLLTAEYEIDRETAAQDVQAFLDGLRQQGALR